MLPLQVDDSYDAVMRGWECQETDCGIPYYTREADGQREWDHPYYNKVMEDLDSFHDVNYAAYRTALKLRYLQKKFGLHLLSLSCLHSVFHDHGFPAGHPGMIGAQTLQLVVLEMFHMPDFRHLDTHHQDLASELLYHYLTNLFDVARSGAVKVSSVKLALAALSNSSLSDKYRYFFQEMKTNDSFVSVENLHTFISDLMQIPDLMRESVAFGKNVAAAVDSCLQVGKRAGSGVSENGFYTWLMREPQTLIWLPTLHRMIVAETVKHECKCSVCKTMPMVGFRYKCLQCFKFNICQDCFFRGRVAKTHQIRHPIQEYCLPVSVKDETKVFLKVIRNKISRRSRSKLSFLPVDNTADQGILEWQMRPTPEPPSPPSVQMAEGVAEGADGEAASDDSGHSSDQGGEGEAQQGQPPSPSPRSTYDNSNSPARYLDERQLQKGQGSQQNRHGLIHLVHRLRRENRLLRQQLRARSGQGDDSTAQWTSCATAEVSRGSEYISPDSTIHSRRDSASRDRTASEMSRTISPIGEVSTTVNCQAYTSEFFNSILSRTANSIVGFDITKEEQLKGVRVADSKVFASTPAMSATVSQARTGPTKPPRLTGSGDANTVSISYITTDDSTDYCDPDYAPIQVSHKAEVHHQPGPASTGEQDDMGSSGGEVTHSTADDHTTGGQDETWTSGGEVTHSTAGDHTTGGEDETWTSGGEVTHSTAGDHTTELSVTGGGEGEGSCGDTGTEESGPMELSSIAGVSTAQDSAVTCEEIWGDHTPCTIRKKVPKPTRLVSQQYDDLDLTMTPKASDTSSRRRSTGSLDVSRPDISGVQALGTPEGVKHSASMNRLGFRTPGVDKSLFRISRGDSILKTPERQEIDEMIQWIDNAFPSDLTYSALSLCPDISTGQTRMLQAAEGIGHAMADLVQAAADNCHTSDHAA